MFVKSIRLGGVGVFRAFSSWRRRDVFLDEMATCDGRLGVVAIAAIMTVIIIFEYESLVNGDRLHCAPQSVVEADRLCCALAASSVLDVPREWPFAVEYRP